MRIALISDLHFFKFNPSPSQFCSKRFVANWNGLLNRSKVHRKELAGQFLQLLENESFTHLIFMGDFTTSSYALEYLMAREFLHTVKQKVPNVYAIPGNHDCYVKSDLIKMPFYHLLDQQLDFQGNTPFGWSLDRDRIASYELSDEWTLVMIDAAVPMPFFRSGGLFSDAMEEKLSKLLSAQSISGKKVILSCHFPLESDEAPARQMQRRDALKKLIANHPSVQLYVHGHTHKAKVTEPANGLPYMIDTGSLTDCRKGSYKVIEIEGTKLEGIESYSVTAEVKDEASPQPQYERSSHVQV
ncbi:MAG: 3',5'-cyclic adenosine monophosphate phosphodiesterase CpdA [Chlamydiia bacterium]|nr:3',5'-cyclic adenosine monophosphate phosphodiesterase CpdA [Chlamydiia bacterium]